tara:strand:- start:216 stop:554 length:339 start_codon:yes stop_codon:yes gene_type:complete
MLCPKCHSEYLDHLKECGGCKTDLISASPIDIPIPEMMWSPLILFDGKVYADMAAELLDNNSIPYYFKMDWASSAFSIEATTITGQIVRIFVPKEHLDKANRLASSITGKRI